MKYNILEHVRGSVGLYGSFEERRVVAEFEADTLDDALDGPVADRGLWVEDDAEIPMDDGAMLPLYSEGDGTFYLHWQE
jgi:hypothetical protein